MGVLHASIGPLANPAGEEIRFPGVGHLAIRRHVPIQHHAEQEAFFRVSWNKCGSAFAPQEHELDGAKVEARFPGLHDRLVEDDLLRSGLAVIVDGANSRRRLRAKVQPESELYFIESLGGGGLTPTLELKRS